MKNSRRSILALIILLAVGFAAVTTTLVINGTSLFGINNDDFDVYFSKAIIDGVENNALISQDGKSITYETANLQIVGDISELEYTITNNSSQYDAEVSIECDFTGNEYVTLDNSLQDEIIEAKSEESGTLTARLIKTSTEDRSQGFVCTIVANAVERETMGEDTIIEGESSTYSLYGYLVDENEEILPNMTLVAYSDPIHAMSGENGYLYMEGIDKGSHTLYVIDETLENVKILSEEELKTSSITYVGFTTNSLNIVFPNGYKIVDNVIEKTKKYNITFDADSGEIEETEKQVTRGLTYGELPTPTKTGNWTFDGWYTATSGGTKITSTTKVTVTANQNLYAHWVCAVGDVCIVEGTGETIEDILQIGNEQFYVISNDGTNIKMMSMYNLYVGGDYSINWTAYENPTGIQDSTMRGYGSVSPHRGVTAFSSDSQKGTNYSDYTGSIVEGYVNNYSVYLRNTLGVANTATLISKEELETIVGQTLSYGGSLLSAPAFFYSTSYWTRTAPNPEYIWFVSYSGSFYGDTYNYDRFNGVRPVVTISASLIQ